MIPEKKLGERLREEREQRGISLEQIAASTKINVRLLRSIEEDAYHELPVKPFVRNFVRSYCKFLGLDAHRLLDEYEGFLELHCRKQESQDQKFSGYAFEKRDQDQTRKILWAVLGSFAVIGGVALLILKPTLKHRKNRHAEELKAKVAVAPTPDPTPSVELVTVLPSPTAAPVSVKASSTPAPKASVKPSPSPKPKASPTPPAETAVAPVQTTLPDGVATPVPTPTASPTPTPSPVPSATPRVVDDMHKGADLKPEEIKEKLLLKVSDTVWVRYQVDDRKVMSFGLKAGLMLSLKAKSIIRFQTAHPELIQYKIPGRTGYMPLPGESIVVEGRQATDDPTLFSSEKPLP